MIEFYLYIDYKDTGKNLKSYTYICIWIVNVVCTYTHRIAKVLKLLYFTTWSFTKYKSTQDKTIHLKHYEGQ